MTGVNGRPLPVYKHPCGAGRRRRWTAAPGSELALLRKQVHRGFDTRWKHGGMSRSGAYRWLAKKMNMPLDNCHVGMFDEEECRKALDILLADDFS